MEWNILENQNDLSLCNAKIAAFKCLMRPNLRDENIKGK